MTFQKGNQLGKGRIPWHKGKTKETDSRLVRTEEYIKSITGKGNAFYGKKHTLETRNKMHKKHNIGTKISNEKNGMWKGNQVGFSGLHCWINTHKPKPELCENCKERMPYDLANISGEYKRDINDFEWLCRKCHMIKDGRLNNLIMITRNNPRLNQRYNISTQ